MIKELTLPLGALEVVNPLELVAGQIPTTGWYVDQATGRYYYYDAVSAQWYYYAAGYLYALAVSWKPSPSPMLELFVGDTLRITFSFKYIGPGVTGKRFHAAIGEEPGEIPPPPEADMAEIKCEIRPFDIPRCDTTTTITKSIDIEIPSAAAGEVITAYVKWEGWPWASLIEGENCTPYYYNVATIAPVKGVFTEFKITEFEKA